MESSDLRQLAVYWAKSGLDNYGQPTLSDPIQIPVRFEKKTGESVGPDNQTIRTDAFAAFDRAVVNGSLLWVGDIDDIPASPTPRYQITHYNEIPDIKGRTYRRTALLIRYDEND